MTRELSQPTAYANTQAFPQTAPIVRTRFVTTRNIVGFARKKVQTISFIEREFERLGLGHKTVGFSWQVYVIKIVFALGAFLLEAGWEALVFGHFFPAPSVVY